MAFPIPLHLPRKNDARDVSTQILSKISETPAKALNSQLASSWLTELESTIQQTKTRIHERISSDLPNFDRQLATSVSVQERLRSLAHNVDVLHDVVSNPECKGLAPCKGKGYVSDVWIMHKKGVRGLIPNLVDVLSSHFAFAQEASDARAQHDALSHLLRCRNALRSLTNLVEKAQLADATGACASLDVLISTAPGPLQHSEVLADLKRKSTALRNRTEEQLVDAYSRSVMISASGIYIKPSVQAVLSRRLFNGQWVPDMVPGDNIGTDIGLSALLASMTPTVLSQHLSTLRRDVTTYCVDYVLKQPVQVYEAATHNITGTIEQKLSFERAPPSPENLLLRISNLTTTMAFLSNNLFSHLPSTERKSLTLSLCTPIRTALLDHLLLPNLPSSLSRLAEFLMLAERAVQAEDEIVGKMLGDNGMDRSVKSWVDGIGLHYERKRRAELLDKARVIALSAQDDSSTFHVDVPLVLEDRTIPIQTDNAIISENGGTNRHVASTAGDAWAFDKETTGQNEGSSADEWGFDDDEEPEPVQEPEAEQCAPLVSEPHIAMDDEAAEEDAGDAWDWNDDTEPIADEDQSAWDDTWGEKSSAPVPPSPVPKPAKGLEKKFPPKSVPALPPAPPPSAPMTADLEKAPAPPPPKQVAESYVVSGRTKELLQLVEDVLREGAELVSSGLLTAHAHSGSPGSVLMQAAPMALELFRALVPVAHSSALKQSAKEPMRFSNDCLYIGQELARVVLELSGLGSVESNRLADGLDRLKVLADSWFEDAIAHEERTIDELLEGAGGFIDTPQQDRYDECESAINEVLRRIRRVAPQWKGVLAKSRYYDALGLLVEAALSRILVDILALQDITEVESHRLSELCRILNALEGLFVEDPERPSFVVSYVPSWLKFSYLSELLEASIADILYLFEEGLLVDFEIEELAKLVRALFADTPLRANTINRLMQGHPVRS